jgi:hypothetical protein
MTKITPMKASILRTNLMTRTFTFLSTQSIMQDLEDWYSELPHQMHVSKIGQEDLAVEVRRTICHVHLLYLGTVLLLYRRVLSHAAQSCDSEQEQSHLGLLSSLGSQAATVSQITEKRPLAAKLSARILDLLLTEDGVCRRCWVVM